MNRNKTFGGGKPGYPTNYIALEITDNEKNFIKEYKDKGKLHPNFLPFPVYNLVQMGYPYPNHGGMVYRDWGGIDENDVLLPSNGIWCKVEDVKKYLKELSDKQLKEFLMA